MTIQCVTQTLGSKSYRPLADLCVSKLLCQLLFIGFLLLGLSACEDEGGSSSSSSKPSSTGTDTGSATATVVDTATDTSTGTGVDIDPSADLSFSCVAGSQCSVSVHDILGTWASSTNQVTLTFSRGSDNSLDLEVLGAGGQSAVGGAEMSTGILRINIPESTSSAPFFSDTWLQLSTFTPEAFGANIVSEVLAHSLRNFARIDCQNSFCTPSQSAVSTQVSRTDYDGTWVFSQGGSSLLFSLNGSASASGDLGTLSYTQETGELVSGNYQIVQGYIALQFNGSGSSLFPEGEARFFQVREVSPNFSYWSPTDFENELVPADLQSTEFTLRCANTSGCGTGEGVSASDFALEHARGTWALSVENEVGVPRTTLAIIDISSSGHVTLTDFLDNTIEGNLSISSGVLSLTTDRRQAPLFNFDEEQFSIQKNTPNELVLKLVDKSFTPSNIDEKEDVNGRWQVTLSLDSDASLACSEDESEIIITNGSVKGGSFQSSISIDGTVDDQGNFEASSDFTELGLQLTGTLDFTIGSGLWSFNRLCSGNWTAVRLGDIDADDIEDIDSGIDCGSSQAISISDSIFEACLREHSPLNRLLPEEAIKKSDACEVKTISCRFTELRNVVGLENFTELETLNLTNNKFLKNLDASALTKLKVLNLSNNALTWVGGLDKMDNLEVLDLDDNKISVLGDISNLSKLEVLDLSRNRFESVQGLGSLPSLRELNLSRNEIKTLQSLDVSTELEILDISENYHLSNVGDLSALVNLKKLLIYHDRLPLEESGETTISEIEGISKLTELEWLVIQYNSINRLDLTNLTELTFLDASFNQLETVGDLSGSLKLEWVYLSNNNLQQIGDLRNLIFLKELKLFDNSDFDCESLKIDTDLDIFSGCGQD